MILFPSTSGPRRSEEKVQGKETAGFVLLGLRQRVINLASREQTNQNGTTQTAIVLYVRHRDDWYHKLGPRKFAEVHQLNILAIVARLSAKPWIRVESGSFVGRFQDQEYALGSTEAGLVRAIRRMSELRRAIQAEVA